MRHFPFSAVVIASMLLGGAAYAKFDPAAELDRLTTNRTAGKPVNCIQQSDIRSSRIIDGTAIVYRTGNGTLYVNKPEGAAFLRDGMTMVTDTHGDQLCSVDTVKLVDNGSHMAAGSVGLGQFVPYAKAPRNTVD